MWKRHLPWLIADLAETFIEVREKEAEEVLEYGIELDWSGGVGDKVIVYTDPEYGCQYIALKRSGHGDGTLVPRRDAEGNHVCTGEDS